MSRRPLSFAPTILMPAARDEAIDVDLSELLEEDPDGTHPTIPVGATTIRPPGPELDALREVARVGAGWSEEPRIGYDRDRCSWVLAAPYAARQTDRHGNRMEVACLPGLCFELPDDPRELRTAIVAAKLRHDPTAKIYPFTGRRPEEVGRKWRDIIIAAFRDGDLGARERG